MCDVMYLICVLNDKSLLIVSEVFLTIFITYVFASKRITVINRFNVSYKYNIYLLSISTIVGTMLYSSLKQQFFK